jgi:hypothetical protein
MKKSQAEAKVAVDALDGLLQAELSCWAPFRQIRWSFQVRALSVGTALAGDWPRSGSNI